MLELKMVHVAKTAVCNAVRRKQKEAGRSQAETCTLCDSAVGTDKGIVHGNGRICEEPSGARDASVHDSPNHSPGPPFRGDGEVPHHPKSLSC